MGTARVKQEEQGDTGIEINLEERNVGTKGKSLKQGLTSAGLDYYAAAPVT